MLRKQAKKVAQEEVNRTKNRYANIVPYDETRVVLPVIHNDPSTDYINANWIPGYGHPSQRNLRQYIATQGPTNNTFISFWRMILHTDASVIVMVTNLVEKGKQKCHKYWPENKDGSPGASQTYGRDIKVKHVKSVPEKLWVLRTFTVSCKGKVSRVHHFAYTAWPDHGVPADVKELLYLRRAVRAKYTDTRKPLVVHCSAGVGRTGTFMAVDMAVAQLLDAGRRIKGPAPAKVVDAFGICCRMRTARNLMVQTEAQYQCLYSTILVAVNWLLDRERLRAEAEAGARARAAAPDRDNNGLGMDEDGLFPRLNSQQSNTSASSSASYRLASAIAPRGAKVPAHPTYARATPSQKTTDFAKSAPGGRRSTMAAAEDVLQDQFKGIYDDVYTDTKGKKVKKASLPPRRMASSITAL